MSKTKTGLERRPDVPVLFISSTSEDLRSQRDAVRDAAIPANFLPRMMEYFAASGERPPLEACWAKVDEADVLVVIVAHRYGWVPPGQPAGEDKSITWLECEHAVAAGTEVLAFLVDKKQPWPEELREEYPMTAAIRAGTAKPKLLKNVQTKVNRLRDFKAWLNGRAIRAEFTTEEDLRAKVTQALNDWRTRHAAQPTKPPRAKTPVGKPVIPPHYLTWLQGQCNADVELLGLQVKEGRAIRLNQVYVPLTTTSAELPKDEQRADAELSRMHREQPTLLLDRLAKNSLYVSGAPGSGKSTFCRWVAWLAATGEMPAHAVAAPDEYQESFPGAFRDRLPVLVQLREFWNCLPKTPGRRELSRCELEASLSMWIEAGKFGGIRWHDIESHLAHGSALLLFDGVDEIPTSIEGAGRQAHYPREMLLAGLADAVGGWTQDGNHVLITSRPYGLEEADIRKLGLPHAPIAELAEPLQELLVRRWFHVLKDAAAADDMLAHLRERGEELQHLSASPMLLTAMCVIYREGKRLPQHKFDLYSRIVDFVLYNRWRDHEREIPFQRNRLRVIAYGMHTGAGLAEKRRQPQALAGYDEIERIIQQYQDNITYTEEGFRNAVDARDELLSRSGLLLPRPNKQAAFYHLTFQDFLAAERLLAIAGDRLFDEFRERAEVPEWRSALAFVFGAKLDDYTEQRVKLLRLLIESTKPTEVGLQALVAECLLILLGRKIGLQPPALVEQYKQLCLATIEHEEGGLERLSDRWLLGIVLGKLGDPRIVTDLDNPASFVEVPADTYKLGNNNKPYKLEQSFLISRYPITNAQFAAFVENGYGESQWWSAEGWVWRETKNVQQPQYWRSGKWNAPNQPVVGVSFHEAQAFCKWAGGRLPTEQEWEAAARGPEGHAYPGGKPWEDGICNSGESGLNVTSPVGLFPRSGSWCGVDDMAGNVWEWCSDYYDQTSKDNWMRETRVLRGGSWNNSARVCRAAYRNWSHPDSRLSLVGFRLVCSRQDS